MQGSALKLLLAVLFGFFREFLKVGNLEEDSRGARRNPEANVLNFFFSWLFGSSLLITAEPFFTES